MNQEIDVPDISLSNTAKSPLQLTKDFINEKKGAILGYGGISGFLAGVAGGGVYLAYEGPSNNPAVNLGEISGFGLAGSVAAILAIPVTLYTYYQLKAKCETRQQQAERHQSEIKNASEDKDSEFKQNSSITPSNHSLGIEVKPLTFEEYEKARIQASSAKANARTNLVFSK